MKWYEAFSTGVRETLCSMLVTFMTLKFCGLIDWSWWWVLAPIWVSAAIAGIAGIAVLLFVVIWRKRINRE